MSERFFLNTERQLENFCEKVRQMRHDNPQVCVQFVKAKRNTDQNALYHNVLRLIAAQKGDESIDDLKARTKLMFGVPIMRSEDDEFKHWYDEAIKHRCYEDKIATMHYVPVTSLMNTAQFSTFVDQVIHHFVEEGYDLTILGK